MKLSEAIKLIENKTGKKIILKEDNQLDKPIGEIITRFDEINKKNFYCIYEPGMNNWLPNFKLNGFKKDKIVFKSTEQFDDMTFEFNISDFFEIILYKDIRKQLTEFNK
jgi:hypothetical protein